MNKETEIHFADLFAMLLKAFVPLICIVLIVGMLGGAYGIYSTMRPVPESEITPTITETDLTKAEKAVAKAEKAIATAEANLNKLSNISILEAQKKIDKAKLVVERRRQYVENSLYQQLDPFNCGVSRLMFYIKTDFAVKPDVAGLVEDPQSSIALAYSKFYTFDDEILEQVQKIMNVQSEKRFIQEMITVQTTDNRFVEIRVYNNDASIAESVVKYLFQTMQERLQGVVAEHSANIVSTFTGYEVNWTLSEKQMNNLDSVTKAEQDEEAAETALEELQNSVADSEKAIEDAKLAYEEKVQALEQLQQDYDAEQKEIARKTKPSKRARLMKGVKFGAVGLAAGLVIGCLIILAVTVLNGKLHNQSEARSRYAFPVLGVLPRTKKILFEKTVRKLEGESLGSYKAEARATAQSMLSRIGDRSVCLVSSQGKEIAKKLADFTEGRTPVLGNILSDAEAVKSLADYDGIVLVEQKGKSRISEIDSEVLRAKALDKEIVGIVLM